MLDIYLARVRGYESNCYMLVSDGQAAVVDPSVPISAFDLPDGIKVCAVLLTHGHFDHILQLDSYIDSDVKLYVSAKDAYMLRDPMANASSLFGLPPCTSNASPVHIEDGDAITLGSSEIKVMCTPGHTEGSVCYLAEGYMLSGDTLFADGIGRCDLIGGNYGSMQSSLKKLASLDFNYKIYPGHGELTTLNKEKKYNYELSRYIAQNI